MSKFEVQFLTRNRCPLCDAARPLVNAEVARYGGTVQELDVDASDSLRERYGSRIPVVIAEDERVIAEGRIEKRALRRGLRGLRRSGG
ncbi:MAG: glutaredoxin family protein [Acidimicrobiia bacterium]